jgi:hypothetical protein
MCATFSNRHAVSGAQQVEITAANQAVFDPQRQMSWKFFWCSEVKEMDRRNCRRVLITL